MRTATFPTGSESDSYIKFMRTKLVLTTIAVALMSTVANATDYTLKTAPNADGSYSFAEGDITLNAGDTISVNGAGTVLFHWADKGMPYVVGTAFTFRTGASYSGAKLHLHSISFASGKAATITIE